ncbi:Oidioi.mRNA.OKI2018_I69.PAR.g11560.t1.cds [Oikopleura dioica]|uniref:Oidioi.mRNA.OKI2018_I69.PAR.g11560.t1.cds n=1 Tax=Oikopleura dioica TaxID=34765 RepID=A0ABN7RZB3_OIKDI|nr:Oidioi.mRNA.OKI2018_I69.PAR.g11560.t1.cds [Oikopleura dioica]
MNKSATDYLLQFEASFDHLEEKMNEKSQEINALWAIVGKLQCDRPHCLIRTKVILSCGHKLCEVCLKRQRRMKKCPLCRCSSPSIISAVPIPITHMNSTKKPAR